jgi:dihydrofolate reductase
MAWSVLMNATATAGGAARPDEYRVTLVPYVAGEGARLFENAGKSRRLDLLSSTAFSNGLQLDYRRHR